MATLKIIIILSLFWTAAVKAGVEEDALKEHNRLRDLHGVPHLKLSADLNRQAKAYATELAKLGDLKHSKSDGKYGENLCYRSHNPEECTQNWYDEIEDYDFNNPGFSMETGHFTALVWASSKELGYGQAKSEKGIYFVVAMYVPAGNMEGEFDTKVPKLLKDGTTARSKSSKITLSINVMIISICFGLLKVTN